MRGSGRTTKAMREAPQGALYIWCNDRTEYAKQLACKIGRNDLEILCPDNLNRSRIYRLRGREFSGVIVDHATAFSYQQSKGYQSLLVRVR